MIDPRFHDDLIAELLALNMALHRILNHLANLSGDRRNFLVQELELGLKAISETELWSVPKERREAVYENARARYQNIVGSLRA